MHGRSLLGALVLAATFASVLGTALERGSGACPASPRAESRDSGHIEGPGADRCGSRGGPYRGGHSRAEPRALGVGLEAAPFVALAAAAAVAGRLARPLSARRPRPT
jgi:hypothetical protein